MESLPLRLTPVIGALLVAGCVGVPRQYDGVVGYRVESIAGGTRATYVDELRVDRDLMLARLALICRKAGASGVAPVIVSEETFEQDGYFRITLPGGTGERMADYLATPGELRQFVMHEETFPGRVKLRKIVVLCPAEPSPRGVP